MASSKINLSMEPRKIGEVTHNNPQLKEMQNDLEKEVARGVADRALSNAKNMTKSGAIELKSYVVENPAGLKTICFLTGLCLMAFSVIGIINITNIAAPIDYIVTFFNFIFGFIILLTEGKSTWSFCGLREKVFRNCGFLTYPSGRAVFYIYVGIMVLGILPTEALWKALYIVMGAALALCGILQLCRDKCWSGPNQLNHQHFNEERV